MSKKGYVAFDLGAESGRAMLAVLDQGQLTLQEAHRFANLPVTLPTGLHWDITGLFRNLVEGLRAASVMANHQQIELVSLGVDTWGVDFGLIGEAGELLALPHAYRDASHPQAMEQTLTKVSKEKLYEATGIQPLFFNTIFQLLARQEQSPGLLEKTSRLLNTPDLLHYFFTGQMKSEMTIASTSSLLNASTGDWDRALLDSLNLPHQMLGDVVPAGTQVGTVREELASAEGVPSIAVVAPAGHDTASAIAAVPVSPESGRNWAYLSSGTWSLMGMELDDPIVTPEALQAGFTNERGVNHTIRFLKNIAGLWLIQQVRKDFARQGQDYDYPTLEDLSAESQPLRTLVDPGHAPFAMPGDICAKIEAFARKTDQPIPQTPGQYVRCCVDSLALSYRKTARDLEKITGRSIGVLHIVGGGGKHIQLDQLTADAIGCPVVVGPYEATAVGNALVQAMGMGQVADLAALREIVRASFEPKTFTPGDTSLYDDVAERFESLIGAGA